MVTYLQSRLEWVDLDRGLLLLADSKTDRKTIVRPCTHKSRLVSSGWSMCALPPKADIRQRIEHVCFVLIADISVSIHDTLCGNNRH
jgi:hypothetical protein